MCGRFSQGGEEVVVPIGDRQFRFAFSGNFNLAPSQRAGVIIPRDTELVPEAYVWGFIPHFQKTKPKFKPINARSEGVMKNGIFRGAVGGRRCLVPATGWYEWKTEHGHKFPWRTVRRDQQPIFFAGFYAHAEPDGVPVDTFAILTRDASPEVAHIHDRMPVIVPDKDLGRWLDPKSDSFRTILEKPLLTGFESYPVTPAMNSPKFNSPECLKPLAKS
jgi:putative SOS response-associated peptidase YedK